MHRLYGVTLLAAVISIRLAAGDWSLHPSADKGNAPEYKPAFEKHFSVADGVLTCRCGLGDEFYKNMEAHNIFVGTGPLWVTHAAWPKDVADFDFTVEYKWFQQEPMEKYGDFPDLKLGFRLDAKGAGYYLHWGMLGQVLIKRLTPDGKSIVVAHGTLPGRKSVWCKLRIRAVGPMLKAKVWPADKPEPATWTAEGYDEWPAADGPLYKQGAIALGFYGRKLFDTCVYDYRNAVLKPLTADEAKAEKSFDASTMPTYLGRADGSDTTPIVTDAPAELWKDESSLTGWEKDSNLKVTASPDGLVLASTDGKPAFAWRRSATYLNTARMKASAGARPLLAVRSRKDGKDVTGILDPAWRSGLTALLYQDAAHISGAYRFQLKPDAWYDFVSQLAHWHKWQIVDPENRKDYAAFASAFMQEKADILIGVGVAGTGTVTVKGVTSK